MTREEALKIWLPVIKMGVESMQECSEALEMAIKALEQEPCADAMSRQAVIEVLNKMDRYVADELTLCDTERKFPQNEVFIVDDVYEEIVEQLPPVTPQPKIGKWRTVKHYGRDYYQCTYCSMERIDDHSRGWNYCPFCGAKMSDVDA